MILRNEHLMKPFKLIKEIIRAIYSEDYYIKIELQRKLSNLKIMQKQSPIMNKQ